MTEKNFSAEKLRPDTWIIRGGGDSCDRFLLAGSKEAIMIDAGCSVNNIREFAQGLTSVPVRAVINTHSHFDHTGGNGFFDIVYLTEETSRSARNTMGQPANCYPLDYEYTFVHDGDIIEPGDRPLQIIKLDCHAPGSLAVLDKSRRMLFTGDEVDSGQVLLLPGYAEKQGQIHARAASTVETCLSALRKLAGFRNEFDFICPAHNGAPISADWINRYIEAAQAILDGAQGSEDCSSESYSRGDAHYPLPQANYRRFTLHGASLVYCADLIYDSDYARAGNLSCATELHRISADTARPTAVYSGIAGAGGIAAGKAYVLANHQTEIEKRTVAADAVNTELEKVREGIELSVEQLVKLKKKVLNEFGESKAQIFEAHRMMLEDPEFIGAVKEEIVSESVNAAYAVKKVADSYIAVFDQMKDDYMRERAADIQDVSRRLTSNILGISPGDIPSIDSPVIIVAHDLTPSDTAMLNKDYVLGFTAEVGGSTSHTAIMARSLGIPAVLGLGDVSGRIRSNDDLIIDGFEGKLIVNPDKAQKAEYERKIIQYRDRRKKLEEAAAHPAVTPDGRRIEISCNIGTPKDIHGALENGCDGVGLFRTEFLYMNSNALPDEDEQYEQYRRAAVLLEGRPLIIRTLDIGGDKKLPYLPMPEEMNPFLGWRAIRICLERQDIFKTQLRAILRAGADGNVRIMFPMISGVREVREAKKVLEEAKEELKRENIKFDEDMKVGIMVEIPSAAMTADTIAKEVDFFSIGTNDLCQYALAVDRMNPKVSGLYQPLHPGILRLIKNVIDASHRHGKLTGMCGEMAGAEEACAILLGLGLDEFSMSASAIPAIKNIVRNVTHKQAEEIANHALELDTPEEVLEYSKGRLSQIMRAAAYEYHD